MNRFKRLFGFHNVLERAWAETQLESPDTVLLADHADAAQALDAMRQAFLAQGQGQGGHQLPA